MQNDVFKQEINEFSLRDYQIDLPNKIREEIKKGNRRICAVLPTGAGKGRIIAYMAKSALDKGNKVLIVLPRRSLVSQLSEVFSGFNINHGVLMSGNTRHIHSRCLIASVDTYMAWLSSGKTELISSDVLYIDELHMQFTAKKLAVFDKYKFVISFSATPIAPKKQSLNTFYDGLVVGVSVKELQEKGYLAKLRYYADPSIDLTGLKVDSTGDWRKSMLGDVMDKPKLVGDIVNNWLRIAKGIPTVCFASSQAHARHLSDEFESVGYRFEYLDCNTPDDERQAIFARIKKGKSTGIVNYSIVGVGVDIPNLKCCILARPTKLITNYHQYVGRITRPDNNKEGIVIDHAGIIERLGFLEDEIDWTLDGNTSIEEKIKEKKEEAKEPKEIICGECGTVFKSRRNCPACGYEMISIGEPIPVHEAELKEVKAKSIDKRQFYSELLGYARNNGKSDSYALAIFRSKFNEWPYGKRSIKPSDPTSETLGYIKYSQIKWAKSRAA